MSNSVRRKTYKAPNTDNTLPLAGGCGASLSPNTDNPLPLAGGSGSHARGGLFPPTQTSSACGFTLPEMLIAMAVTLLLMGALAKSFGLIGESVRDGRARVELTGLTRDITLRINDELSRTTVSMVPPTTQNRGDGYLLYYEGPMTDVTGGILGRSPDDGNEFTLQDTKFGDLDDYLAFTARAPEGQWFRGKVPRFLLDRKTAEREGVPYDPGNFAGGPLDPVVITSKFAEIVYFVSPEYQLDPSSGNYLLDANGTPQFTDFEGNGLPDRIRLHRRVLLIRPDLNLTASGGTIPLFNYNGADFMVPRPWPGDWLTGMAPVHQQCDLSLRRVINRAGQPTNQIAANSLADLTRPENRFAHVRVPGNQLGGITGGAGAFTSMPLLATGGLPPILTAFPGVVPPAAGQVISPSRLHGLLRPEFVLGQDLIYNNSGGTGTGWGFERWGEDILATNVLGFDVQAFDPQVQTFLAPGPDGVLDGGFNASDDVIVTPADVGYREALEAIGAVQVSQRGGFVDLAYPFLAGGTIRGFGGRASDRHGTGTTTVPIGTFRTLDSAMSGLTNAFQIQSSGFNALYTRDLYKSGRVLTDLNGNVVLFQPAYDTFSDHYERDGYLQTFPSFNGGAGYGTVWYLNDPATGNQPGGHVRPADMGSNGIDDGGLLGVDDVMEQETRPPFGAPLRALRVSVRLENPTTRQIQQMSSLREFVE